MKKFVIMEALFVGVRMAAQPQTTGSYLFELGFGVRAKHGVGIVLGCIISEETGGRWMPVEPGTWPRWRFASKQATSPSFPVIAYMLMPMYRS